MKSKAVTEDAGEALHSLRPGVQVSAGEPGVAHGAEVGWTPAFGGAQGKGWIGNLRGGLLEGEIGEWPTTLSITLFSRYLVAASQTAEYILQQLTGASQTQECLKLGASCMCLLNLDVAELPELYSEASILLRVVD